MKPCRFLILPCMLITFSLFFPTVSGALSRETAVVRAARKVSPAVVNIGTVLPERRAFHGFGNPFFDEFFRDFMIPQEHPRPEADRRTTLGSGVIIDGRNGLILTNAHVISQAGAILVTLQDEREFEAEVVGADSDSDIAVLRIPAKKRLPEVEMGDSGSLMIGEEVIAIGNPFGFSHTVTRGVVSALNRSIRAEDATYHDFIQTDASINPGNSGGPLLNINGELIGINTAIYAKARGIGFAIPISKARRVVDDLVRYGEVGETWIGVEIQRIDRRLARYLGLPPGAGVLVNGVDPDSPAARAGIREGDVIWEVGGFRISSVGDFNSALRGYAPGDKVNMDVMRQGATREIRLAAALLPPEKAAAIVHRMTGIRTADAPGGRGAMITAVHPDSWLARIGAAPGDLIRKVDESPVSSRRDFERIMIRYRSKSAVVLLLVRNGQGYYITLRF